MRVDVFLVERGYAESRNKAQRLISEGKVLIDGTVISKPSYDITDACPKVEITEIEKYVGRGGLKLEAALGQFKINVSGMRCIDIGASTGGFTDCLLQNGASYVCAIDSGRDQLHRSLISNPKVRSVEGFNARELNKNDFGVFDCAVMDVSFISQTLLHKVVFDILNKGGMFISLIKPQFEVGKASIGKNGIVKDFRDRENAILKVVESARLYGFKLSGLIRSPICGGDGNIEFLACFTKSQVIDEINLESLKQICK